MLHDAEFFANDTHEAIASCSLQTYISAVIFTPRETSWGRYLQQTQLLRGCRTRSFQERVDVLMLRVNIRFWTLRMDALGGHTVKVVSLSEVLRLI